MKSILEALAHGEISPLASSANWDSHYCRVIESIAEYEDKLLYMLDGEARELLKKFSAAHSEANETANIDSFICGYRLGALMMVEVFAGRETIV